MAKDSTSVNSGSIGWLGWLGLIFISLKLMGYISWPWVWVLAPIWAPISVIILLLATAAILVAIIDRK